MDWIREHTISQNTKVYQNDRQALRFLLGGIGTGNISMDASGRLCDFEMLNRPNKGVKYPYTFFSIWFHVEGEAPQVRVLEAKPLTVSDRALGVPSGEVPGLPRFDQSRFSCQYPFGRFEFIQDSLPFAVSMEAYTPFIPLNAADSSLPGFKTTVTVKNLSKKRAAVSACLSAFNLCGYKDFNPHQRLFQKGIPTNVSVVRDGLTGISMTSENVPDTDLGYGTMAIAAQGPNVTVKPNWQEGGWFDGAEEFWQDFKEDGELCANVDSDSVGSMIHADESHRAIGSVASKKWLEPDETASFIFYYYWHFPNRLGWWPDVHQPEAMAQKHAKVFTNHYATLWKDAWDALSYHHKNLQILEGTSRTFANALYSSTLTPNVIESLVSSITVLRSNTVFRLSNGDFYGWEGCAESAGSCAGTCTHVWNYAQTAAFLFPVMEQSMRRIEFLQETDEQGEMAFRAKRYLDGEKWDMLPAADGQWGSIARVYREWKLSGDHSFLREIWDKVAQAVDYGLAKWDADRDGVMECQQHNTYDIEFYGITSLTNSIMYAALLAAAEMADFIDDKRAGLWRSTAQKGAEKMDALLWTGEFYKQLIDPEDLRRYRYQFGDGCLSDQLLGQTFAHLYGLGYVLPKDHVRRTMQSIYEFNFRKTLEDHHCVQRGYAYQDEGGLLLCSWPHGKRPAQPFVYCDEIWTGIEYHVATSCIYEGMTGEALEMIDALRNRYDGKWRSPYNEIECGNHYARSMAAWGILVALSGYQYDLGRNEISFTPRINENDFCCFYSNAKEWGVYSKTNGVETRTPLYKA